jgi:colicin import membrane protein
VPLAKRNGRETADGAGELEARAAELARREQAVADLEARAERLAQREADVERAAAELQARFGEAQGRRPADGAVPAAPDADLARRARELDEREQELETTRQELAEAARAADERLAAERRRIVELVRREQAFEERLRAVKEPEAAAPPPSAPAPGPRQTPSTDSAYTLPQLERLVAAAARHAPERADEWTAYLFFLRDHAEPDGRLPARFDALVAEVFADVL